MEQLLAMDGIGVDGRLSGRRNEPIPEATRSLVLGVGVFHRIEQYHVIAVHQAGIAFDEDPEIRLVAEIQPRPAGRSAYRRSCRRPH